MLYAKPNTQSKLGTGSRKECLVCMSAVWGGGDSCAYRATPPTNSNCAQQLQTAQSHLLLQHPLLHMLTTFLGVSRTLFLLSLSVYVYSININTRFYFICANSYISSAVQRVMNKQKVVIKVVSTAYYCNRFKNQAYYMQQHFHKHL